MTLLTSVLVEAVKELREENWSASARRVIASSVLPMSGLIWGGLMMAGMLLGWRFRLGR